MANKSGININPKHKGEFTKKAKAAGMSVQAFAKHVHAHPDNYSAKTRKQAGFAAASTKFKHQTGGYQPEIENTNPGMNPIQAPDPNNPTFNFMDNVTPYAEPGGPQQPSMQPQQGGRYRLPPRIGESPIVNTFNGAASIVTALGNLVQNGKQNRSDRQRFIQGITPQYMQNMEGAGLNQGPAYTMYGGNSDRATYYGGGMHGEGGTEGIQDHTTGPNFRQYSRGIDSDTADMRTEADVPVAGKPGKMPRRYMVGGRGPGFYEQDLMEMMYGGADFGVPRSYSDMDNEDYGYAGIAHNGPYGQNSVYRNGGQVSPDKAKEILKDGTANGKPLTDRQRRYFGWLAGGAKAQTGGPVNNPQQNQPPAQQGQPSSQLGPEDYYKASATLAYYKDKLNAQLKQKNPQAYGDYFKGLVDQRRAGNVKGAQDYVQNSQYNEYLSPDEVKKTLGTDKDYQNYLNSIKQVNTYNVAQGQQPLYGTEEGQQDLSNLNYGRRFASLQVTPSFGKTIQGGSNGDKHYNRNYQYNPQTGQVDFTEVGDTSIRPEGWAVPAQQQPQQQGTVAARQTGGYGDHSQIPEPPKRRQPIYVNKPNDPRLQRYNDSMTLYNSHKEYRRRLPEVLKHGEENNYKGNNEFVDWAESIDNVADPAYQRLYDYNGELPGTISKDGYRTFALGKDKNGNVIRQRVNDIAIDRPKQEVVYGNPPIPKPVPKKELKPSKIKSRLEQMEEPIEVKGSKMIPADVNQKPTKFSFTGRDENGQQVTRYFPDLESWKSATEAMGYSNREVTDNGNSANATGYQFKMGGRKYQVGGHTYPTTRMQGGGYAVGDEIEMSIEQIEALKKQGYKFENL